MSEMRTKPFPDGDPLPDEVKITLRNIEQATKKTEKDSGEMSAEDIKSIELAGKSAFRAEEIQQQVKELVLTLPLSVQSGYLKQFTNLDQLDQSVLLINQNLQHARQNSKAELNPLYKTLEQIRNLLREYKKSTEANIEQQNK